MLRSTLLMFTLALASLSTGCLDEEAPQEGPQKSGEDDPDFEQPGDREDDPPAGCQQIQDTDDPDCTPKQ